MKFSSFAWNILFTLFLLQSLHLQAAPTKASTSIKDVTVYQQKAKITRTAQVTIPAGASDILLKDLSSKIDGQSLQVTLNDGIKLLSATFQIDHLNDPKKSAVIENLEDSLELVQFELDWVNRQLEVYQSEEKLMDMNSQKVGTETKGLSAQDLKEVMTFYRKQLMEIKKERLKLDRERGKLQNSATRLQKQLQQVLSEKTKAIGEVLLKVVSKNPTTAKIEFSYIVQDAGWKPIYDIRAASIEEPVTLSYKANIFQHTGQDWNNVDLTVSTGNPSKSNDRPILSPSYLAFIQPYSPG
ncbi:MAG: mucoidy inhibitor MuiA family protein, partial [Chitinophagales bacterium]